MRPAAMVAADLFGDGLFGTGWGWDGAQAADCRFDGRAAPTEGLRYAGFGLLVGPAVPADRQHVRLLAARRRYRACRHRLSVVGRPRLHLQDAVVDGRGPNRCSPAGTPRSAAGLDASVTVDRGAW